MDTDQEEQTRWDWLGQGAALDLADTVVKNREGTYEDLLRSFADLQGWLAVEQRWLPEQYALGPADLSQILALREAVRGAFLARVEGRDPGSPDVEVLNALAERCPAHHRLESVDGAMRVVSRRHSGRPVERLLALIAEDAIALLGGSQGEGLRLCPAPSCGMFYVLARSNQRWCSDACGNRVRVARHLKKK